jgi:prepilin signal peptidase PulO-like enzyme (type II secretory pathway)
MKTMVPVLGEATIRFQMLYLFEVQDTMSRVIELIFAIYGFFLGAVFASFGCVVSERVPRGESINGRSHCACGRQLTWWENIPLLGYLSCGGVTRCCQVKLPKRYVLAELSLGLWGAFSGIVGGFFFSQGQMGFAALSSTVLFFLGFGVLLKVTWQKPDPS